MDNEAFNANKASVDSQLFKEIKFYVAGDVPDKILDVLRAGGAEKLCYLSDFVTHMICGKDPSEDDLSSARELYEIPAVRWKWVTACAKLNKLLDTKGFIISETNLFYKMIFSFSKVTNNDRILMWGLITYHGGTVQLDLTRNCTHLITTEASGAKYEKALQCDSIKVITPDWLIQTINSKQLAPYDAFHPRLLVIPTQPEPPPVEPEPEVPSTPTAQITGFEATDVPSSQPSIQSNQALLDQLKQRMPWNQPVTTPSTSAPASSPASQPSAGVSQTQQLVTAAQQQQNRNFQNAIAQQKAALQQSIITSTQNQQQIITTISHQLKPQMQQTAGINNIPAASQAPVSHLPQMSQQSTLISQQNQQLLNQQAQHTLTQQSLNQQQQQLLSQQSQNLNQQSQSLAQQSQMLNQSPQTLSQQQANLNQQSQPNLTLQQQQQILTQQQQALTQQHQNLNQLQPTLTHQQNVLLNQQQQTLTQPNNIQTQQNNIILKTSQHNLPTSVTAQHSIHSQLNNSFRTQIQGNTIHHQIHPNQLSQNQLAQSVNQHIQTNLQRQHILQTSMGQQQLLQAQQQQQQQQQQQLETQQLLNQKLTAVNSQLPQTQQLTTDPNAQQQFITKTQQIQDQIVTTQNVQNVAGLQRLPTPLQQRQQQLVNAQQMSLASKQQMAASLQQTNAAAVNEAMIKQQRLLQQQQQLRIQQLQNSQNSQFIVQQQGAIVNRQQLPPGAIKPTAQTQFIQQTQQTRPVAWQQQQSAQPQAAQTAVQQPQQPQQQQIFLQHRQQGLPGAIQRPPGWTGQPGQLPQRHLIHLDAQTNAQLQQMDPQQKQLFLQKLQKQRQLVMQRQVLQQQQQFAVIRQQVVAGQTQNGQWQQAGPRPPTLVVQQTPAVTAATTIRLPPKPEEAAPPTDQPPLVVNAKTKTALANMLSIRLQSGGPPVEGAAVNEPSAAGTLRLMTAQHNAALQQQRRTLNNAGPVPTPGVAPAQIRTQQPVLQNQPVAGPPRAHFYGHNPNLKLPPNLFLLGCVFMVVEVENFLNKEFPTWQNSIRKYGGEIEPNYCARVTHVLCQSQKHGVVMQALRDTKRCVTIYWLNDVLKKKQVAPPWLAMHLPTSYPDETPGARHLISVSGFNEEDKNKIKIMINQIGARYTCYFSKHNTALICAKPEGDKFNLARKCGIPVLNVQWLSDIMMGNLAALNQTEHARYQQFNVQNPFAIDYNLNPTLMHGWKMPINITQESYERVKRLAPPPITPKPKKPKTEHVISNVPRDGPEPRVLFSQVGNVEYYESIIGRLGGSIATSAKTATHLVMPKLSRSYKFLQCVAKGAKIVPESWLKDSATANKFVSESNHTFSNVDDFNRAFNCDFNKLVQCTDRDKLFKNKIFYLTPSVFPPRQFLKDMIELSGGVVENNRRTLAQIEELNNATPHSYTILTHKDDLHLINDCLVNANSGKPSTVFNTELVLSGILRQQHLFNETKFAVVIVTT